MPARQAIPAQRQPLQIIRGPRKAMHEALVELETALGGAASGREDQWNRDVSLAVEALQEAFDDHVTATEGPDGFYAQVTRDHERLVNAVRRLGAEHVELTADLANVEVMLANRERPASVREVATVLISRFSRHRQRGADLVYEAYNVDIGGE